VLGTAQDIVTDLTNFGDMAVLLPIAAALSIWLAFLPGWRHAAWWALAFALCLGGTAFLKVLFFVCAPAADLRSPSGHTSLSTLVYGGIAAVFAARSSGWQRAMTIGAGGALVLAIAVSRVILNSHTVIETVVGLVIGAVALSVFVRSYSGGGKVEAPLRPLALGIALLVVLAHGQQLHAEEIIRAIGLYIRADGLACS
jgi:membrane-associated phospholipid phosphatase